MVNASHIQEAEEVVASQVSQTGGSKALGYPHILQLLC